MPRINTIFLILLLVIFSGCSRNRPSAADRWDLTHVQRDSLEFSLTHHYSINYNFTVTADSILLLPSPSSSESTILPEEGKPAVVKHGDRLVVAQTLRTDSTGGKPWYVKVAHSQDIMGWVEESKLQESVVPCDPISQAIHAFSNSYLLALLALLAVAAVLYLYHLLRHKQLPVVHFNDIDSLYPSLLCLTTAVGATLYSAIQQWTPHLWTAYYFSPSLNPFVQSLPIAVWLMCVWLMLILFVAALEDVRRQLRGADVVAYILGLLCITLLLYLIFSQTAKIYLGYPLLLLYIVWAIRTYRRQHVAPYLCGHCGHPLHRAGRCPRCGTFNRT